MEFSKEFGKVTFEHYRNSTLRVRSRFDNYCRNHSKKKNRLCELCMKSGLCGNDGCFELWVAGGKKAR